MVNGMGKLVWMEDKEVYVSVDKRSSMPFFFEDGLL